ncbi:MAG TPA: ParB N-terminal domain-containing protein [Thermodesulfobacteriota bacterium]|jgi:ParB family chromosome partitioning protein|nr:ParB N-terminal domain-containing protein [Thermodesulfobacteriota bacterium]
METIQTIPLEQIDLLDETFSVNYLPDLHKLRSSIQDAGLIQPVLLREKSGEYQIICGFRRISVMKELGKSEIESRVFGEKEMDEFQLFSLSLHENLTTRGFNAVEKAIALDKLIHRFQIHRAVVINTFLPFFSLEPNEKILSTFLSLARMEDEIKTYVLKQEVSRANIRRLSALTPDDRMALFSLISPLKLGENRLRELLTLLEEISRRIHARLKEIAGQPEIQAILSQKELTPSQKTERVKKVLTGLRYPELNQLEKTFERKRKDLNLPPNVSLHHPPFFEGKGLKIEFQFESMEEYRGALSTLSQLVDKKEFREMIQKD